MKKRRTVVNVVEDLRRLATEIDASAPPREPGAIGHEVGQRQYRRINRLNAAKLARSAAERLLQTTVAYPSEPIPAVPAVEQPEDGNTDKFTGVAFIDREHGHNNIILVLWHQKGRSLLVLDDDGAFRPIDPTSAIALADLLADAVNS